MDKLAALRRASGKPPTDDVDVPNHLVFEVCSEVGRQGRHRIELFLHALRGER